MREKGLWHPRLAGLVTALGHTDTLVLADAGLPVPGGVETIDLVWCRGRPPLVPVLEGVLGELVVEQATIADEVQDERFLTSLDQLMTDIPVVRTSHDDLKQRCRDARAVVRTGEDTPYTNVILHAGVPF